MTNKNELELGQLCFGNPMSEYGCSFYIEAGLRFLAEEIERVEYNIRQERFKSPVDNNGSSYKTDVFEMNAYYWGDDEELESRPNFKCGDFEVRWYKYLGRGMSMNKNVDANKFAEIIQKCLESVWEKESDDN